MVQGKCKLFMENIIEYWHLKGGNKMLVAGKYDLTNWKEDFKDYLEKSGMTPNTAKDYARRIEKIL